MDPEADPYPIVLTSWGGNSSRAAWVSATFFLVVGVVATYIEWKLCRSSPCGGPYHGIGLLALTFAPIVWFMFKRAGARGLELRIDRDGFVESGARVPWDAVMSLLWRHDDTGEYLEVRVRNIEGYRAPRDRRVLIDHRRYGVPANVLIDALEAAALPRRIDVLAVEPPPKG